MPGSVDIGKDIIAAWLKTRDDVQRIVDFGPGMGTYRKLLGSDYHWTGIEIWEPYADRYGLMGIYDRMIFGDLRSVDWPEADLLIFGDVIEHLPKPDALAVLERTKRYPHVVVSLPLGNWPQGAWEGNPHEEHRSTWTFEEAREALNPQIAEAIPFHFEGRTAEIGIFIR